ncbi:hypothetical protein JTE90_011748 [Oedothorax gibbosus]|uniref:Uncharacterized protein n=1 Tax=Oedothorax gibbosus TaxID=931172 RepID=A0AAV6TLZ9_9ARAC|nr:hypothetical protein JTE90_011748 [Oedothorax gibbosus]
MSLGVFFTEQSSRDKSRIPYCLTAMTYPKYRSGDEFIQDPRCFLSRRRVKIGMHVTETAMKCIQKKEGYICSRLYSLSSTRYHPVAMFAIHHSNGKQSKAGSCPLVFFHEQSSRDKSRIPYCLTAMTYPKYRSGDSYQDRCYERRDGQTYLAKSQRYSNVLDFLQFMDDKPYVYTKIRELCIRHERIVTISQDDLQLLCQCVHYVHAIVAVDVASNSGRIPKGNDNLSSTRYHQCYVRYHTLMASIKSWIMSLGVFSGTIVERQESDTILLDCRLSNIGRTVSDRDASTRQEVIGST